MDKKFYYIDSDKGLVLIAEKKKICEEDLKKLRVKYPKGKFKIKSFIVSDDESTGYTLE